MRPAQSASARLLAETALTRPDGFADSETGFRASLEKVVGRFGDKLAIPLESGWEQLPPGEGSDSPE